MRPAIRAGFVPIAFTFVFLSLFLFGVPEASADDPPKENPRLRLVRKKPNQRKRNGTARDAAANKPSPLGEKTKSDLKAAKKAAPAEKKTSTGGDATKPREEQKKPAPPQPPKPPAYEKQAEKQPAAKPAEPAEYEAMRAETKPVSKPESKSKSTSSPDDRLNALEKKIDALVNLMQTQAAKPEQESARVPPT